MRIVVAGGGVVGLSCGVKLACDGHQVTVLEPGASDAGRSTAPSWNNAGHIATEQVAPLASLATLRSMPKRLFAMGGALDLPVGEWATWLPFAGRLVSAAHPERFRRGSDALRALLGEALPAWQRLTDAIGARDLLREDGHLVAWASTAAAARGRRAWAAADTGRATVHDASAADERMLAALTPTGAAGGAVRFAGTASIRDLTALGEALRAALRAAGGELIAQKAILSRADRRVAVAGVEADAVLVAAGIGSGALMQSVGHVAPIVAERGYHIRASAADWLDDAPPIVFEDRSTIVTRYRDQVQAASFVEVAAPDAPPDPRKWERLERHVRELGLPMRPPFTRWMGARPTLPDYLPAIGRSRTCDNLFYAFGHQHLGLTLAPVTAELVVAFVAGARPAIDLSPFDLARFATRKARS